MLGLLGALAAALCYGIGSVLQSVAAQHSAVTEGLDPRLLLRLLRAWPYLAGLALDALGFLLSVAALQSLPLFVVQAVVASSLAVTAVVGALVLHLPLRYGDRIALAAVVSGLALLGLSAANDTTVEASRAEHWGVLVAAVVLGVAAVPAGRLRGTLAAAVLGGLAGLAFGVVAVAARVLPLRTASGGLPATVAVLLGDPATYALVVSAAVGLLAYATALQRGSVLGATAPLVVTETLAPALVGLLLLGDHARAGGGAMAAVGFVLAVAGALSLSRHGEVVVAEPPRD
jgi:drug/metabolite transporter (DMT)-like permease